MAELQQQIWDLWIPEVGATGMSFARGRMAPRETVLVHAAPEHLDVEVRTSEGTRIAYAAALSRIAHTPMTRLHVRGQSITREDIWPTQADYGMAVILAGGEVGILQHWWNDAHQQQWRWLVEFFNHR